MIFSILMPLGAVPHASAQLILGPPMNLMARAASTSQIDLSWSPPADLGGLLITGYKIDRSTNGGSTWSTIVFSTGNAQTTYANGGLSPGTTYWYRVSAITLILTSAPSNTASATTLTPVTPPGAPSGLVATGGNSQVALSWNAPSSNGGSAITSYDIYRGTSPGGEASGPVASGVTSTRYTDTGVANGQAYYYQVRAVNSAGTGAASNEASATPSTAPGAPSGLVATGGNSQVALSWNAPSSNGGSAITSYDIYRGTSPGGEAGTPLTIVGGSALSYADTSAANGQTYYYTVRASNSAGTGPQSNEASATPSAPVTPPSPPTGLAASEASSSQIDLSWNTPSSDGGSAITGYMVERSSDSGSTWSAISQDTGSTATNYSDSGLQPGITFEYRVSAINPAGTSQPSNTASATTAPLGIHLVQAGLIVSDPLDNETETQQQLQANPGYWTYGGDAPAEGAPYDFFKDTQGLHIGAQAPKDGTWAGYFAMSQNTQGQLFHATVTTPVRTVSNTTDPTWYENGLYVQASQPYVNYVTWFALSGAWGAQWVVASVTGNANQGTQENTLWTDTSTNQPLSRECTIITNGSNYLKVYLDGNLVYQNSTLNLQMPPPFNAYLEPQSSYSGQLLNGTYAGYYSTAGENVQVNGLPPGAARVDLVDSQGNIIASSPASSGTATVGIGQFDFPLAASIVAYDSQGRAVAQSGAMSIYGGDVYAAG